MKHLKEQDWVAVGLDLLVVMVGIFLALQVERLYEDQRLRSEEGEHLGGLLQDFREARDDLDWMIARFESAKAAVHTLIALDAEKADQIDNEEFYRLLAEGQRQASLTPQRQTYDSLVATGAIEFLEDEALKGELRSYFAFVERLQGGRARWDNEVSMLWEPFVLRSLDRNMLIRHSHPEDLEKLEPIHDPDKYREVIGSDEFRSVLAKRWHFYRDLAGGFRELRDRTQAIEEKIEKNLRRFESEN